MTAYFDTSAVISLLIGEPSSASCARMWNEAARSVSLRLLYPEARAALARAERMGGITDAELVLVTGDNDLAGAARSLCLPVALTR